MSDLNAKIVADLKRELAEARAEIEQQRTRAEAAEQEAREERMRADDLLLVVKHCHTSSTHAATMRGLNPAVGSLLHDAGKLSAIRAHIAGVDVVDLDIAVDESTRSLSSFRRPVRQLLAAAREALEP